ncbi:hypothetical protein QBC35DRAFT_535447 [Podospora australis]|uniref:Uncharacterized protein n=1 Tax=Podospora australis TaxID=1536484 RepID=A0AAN6WP77_9PEZI|nr:hypothetical protein QBC35DRAFT_535447 [Podospora australis]
MEDTSSSLTGQRHTCFSSLVLSTAFLINIFSFLLLFPATSLSITATIKRHFDESNAATPVTPSPKPRYSVISLSSDGTDESERPTGTIILLPPMEVTREESTFKQSEKKNKITILPPPSFKVGKWAQTPHKINAKNLERKYEHAKKIEKSYLERKYERHESSPPTQQDYVKFESLWSTKNTSAATIEDLPEENKMLNTPSPIAAAPLPLKMAFASRPGGVQLLADWTKHTVAWADATGTENFSAPDCQVQQCLSAIQELSLMKSGLQYAYNILLDYVRREIFRVTHSSQLEQHDILLKSFLVNRLELGHYGDGWDFETELQMLRNRIDCADKRLGQNRDYGFCGWLPKTVAV